MPESNYNATGYFFVRIIFEEQTFVMIRMKFSEICNCLQYWMQLQKDPTCYVSISL